MRFKEYKLEYYPKTEIYNCFASNKSEAQIILKDDYKDARIKSVTETGLSTECICDNCEAQFESPVGSPAQFCYRCR